MRRQAACGTILGLLLAAGGAPSRAQEAGPGRVSWWASARSVPVAAYANGARLPDAALVLKEVGLTLLPMRTLFQALGAEVHWDARARAVYAWTNDGTGVRFGVGERQAQHLILGGKPGEGEFPTVTATVPLDAPAMLVGGRIYVPVRPAAEALKARVRWVGSEPAIHVDGVPPVLASPSEPAAPEKDLRQVSLALDTTRSRFRRGQQVPLELALRNTGERPVTLTFPTGQRFDFQVWHQGNLVWNWAHRREFAGTAAPLILRPGEVTLLVGAWNQVTNRGLPVGAGRYTVRAAVTAAGGEALTAEREVEITR